MWGWPVGTREAVATLTEQLKAGYLYKRAETRKAKPWGQRWFVLEVMTDAGPEEGTVVRTGQPRLPLSRAIASASPPRPPPSARVGSSPTSTTRRVRE